MKLDSNLLENELLSFLEIIKEYKNNIKISVEYIKKFKEKFSKVD